ncbi:MAG: D-glycero-beta-D-manno-heptose 1-phosphate adenylyltransferase [Planctomycetes bacterium]|nr:D-glycero-beta-D-manno-heptose 1-phosphate adenylyltransferase [Planctomycetota bacterium]
MNIFKQLGADRAGIMVDKSRPTIMKMRFMGHLQTAGKGVQQLLRVDYEKTHVISAEIETQLNNYLHKTIPSCDVVLVSDMNKGLLSHSFLKTIVTLCKKHKKTAIVDPKLVNDYSCYEGFTAMTPNRNETEFATGIKITDNDSLHRAGNKLVSNLSLEYCVITIDKDGMFLGKIGATPVSKGEIMSELMGGKNPFSGKIKDVEILAGILNEHRKKNDKIVFTNGCFDILHIGHIEYLKFARKQGDLLVVGLNTDRSVKGLKGPTRPFVSEVERAKMLSALEDVTYVVLFDEQTPLNLISAVKPDVLVKGEDWKDAGAVGSEIVESYGGKVVFAPFVEGVSTTNIVSRIIKQHSETETLKDAVGQTH